MIVEKVIPAPPSLGARRLERVVLTSGDLAKARQRVTTSGGREIGISLPHGVALKDGDVLHLDAEVAIVVEQADEDLLWLQPKSPEEFGFLGYQVGNLHRAAMINHHGIAVLYDKAMEALAARLRVNTRRAPGKFRPGQTQGHSH
jgi:urease accessory protein UreE